MSEEVLTRVEDGVIVITINRPQAKNAMNRAVSVGICEAVDRMDSSNDIHAGVLTGSGGTFCSGMDLKAFLKGETPHIDGRGAAGITLTSPKKPLIAAIEGYALAGGCEIALACDLIVAGRDAKFGVPEVKRGLAAAGGGLMWLPRQIPPRIATELVLLGDFFSAERAYELGMINRVVDSGKAEHEALAMAKQIAQNGPFAVARSKEIMRKSHDWLLQDMFEKQAELIIPVLTSRDAAEGARAFAEKRKPKWSGC